jgi:hypothetical protein
MGVFEELKNKVSTRSLIIAVIVFVIVIVLWNIASMNTGANEDYLYGLWVGDDAFCEEAEIDSILLFFGEPEHGWKTETRNGYIIIQADGETVYNQGLVLKYAKGWAGPGVGKYTVCGSIDFDEEQIWSEDGRIKITTDMRTGIMRVHYGEQMYAKLYKSMELSNVVVDDSDSDSD